MTEYKAVEAGEYKLQRFRDWSNGLFVGGLCATAAWAIVLFLVW